jgi:hypothetical protein
MPRYAFLLTSSTPTPANTAPDTQERFRKNEIDMILNARVKEVKDDKVVYTTKDANGKPVEQEVLSGFTLWSTGIGSFPCLFLPLPSMIDGFFSSFSLSFSYTRRRHIHSLTQP